MDTSQGRSSDPRKDYRVETLCGSCRCSNSAALWYVVGR